MKAAQKVGINNMADVQEVIGRVQRLRAAFPGAGEESGGPGREPAEDSPPRPRRLSYLRDELDRATGGTLRASSRRRRAPPATERPRRRSRKGAAFRDERAVVPLDSARPA